MRDGSLAYLDACQRRGRRPKSSVSIAVLLLLGVAACSSDGDDGGSATSVSNSTVASNEDGTTGGSATSASSSVDPGTSESSAGGSATSVANSVDAGDEQSTAQRGGELRFAGGTVMSSLDPHNERHEGERPYTFAIYDRLTLLDQSLAVQPMLASEWEFSDDLLTLSLTLRDDITFHDGTPFDAEAVQVNLDRARDPEQATVARQLAAIESVTVVDPTHVDIALKEPAGDLPARLAGPAGAMISPKAISEGRDLGLDPGDAGSGLYIVDEFTPSEMISFVPAPGEPWDETASLLDRLEFQYITDPRAREAALQTGELDVISVLQNPDDIAAAERLADSGDYQFVRVPTESLSALLFRPKVPPLDDIRIRQAISHAINRDAIVNDLLRGSCTAATQFVPEGFPGHSDDFEDPYPYDPDAARALLDEAGGLQGPLEILSFAGSGNLVVPEAVRTQLSEVGIEAQISPLAAVEALTRFRTDAAQAWAFEFLPTVDLAASVADGVLGPQIGADSAELREAVAAAQSAADPDERLTELEALSALVTDQAYMVPLCYGDALYLATADVVGLDRAVVPYNRYMFDVRYIGQSDG